MNTKSGEIDSQFLIGVWQGLSHQTITITSLREDQTFSGTYFTPAMDVRATYAGTWQLAGDIFTMEYTESDSAFFQVPMTDQNRLEKVVDGEMILHTHPQGISVNWKRVEFPTHPLLQEKVIEEVQAPTVADLEALTFDDLCDENPLSSWMFYLVETSSEELFDDKMVDALKSRIPRKAGYFFAISQFEGLWGNGGMQHVLLREEIDQTQYLLKITADGYDQFGCPKVAALIRDLAEKTIDWMKQIDALSESQAPDEQFEPIWEEVDAFDDVYEKLVEGEVDAYDGLLEDLKSNPEDYTVSE